jgi:SAM-dependent methyltransferase
MTTNSEDIKRLVRERYGEKAMGASQAQRPETHGTGGKELVPLISAPPEASDNSTGCAPGCCDPADADRAIRIYTEGQLAGLPAETVAASAGCGNPTALAELRRGERVLDLGSGGGIDCFLAAQQVGEQGHVTGLDMTPEMLALARKNQAALGLTNVEFVHGELEDMPLPDASVDVIISNCVVVLSPDKDAVFREAFRVLTPGGRIHLSDMMSLSAEGPVRADAEAWASCIAGAESREVYLGRLHSAGFVNLEIKEEQVRFDEADGIPMNVASVKVVAVKPS